MRTVRGALHGTPLAGALAGVGAGIALLAVLAARVGLAAPGWILGVACTVAVNGAVWRGFTRSGAGNLGPADWVTLGRAALVSGVAALVADSFTRDVALGVFIGLAAVALALDAVDGRVARRTGTVSGIGARFDMEVDALLVLALAVYDVRLFGAWVLLLGTARYLFVAASWIWPWLRAPVPPRYWAKVVAAIQGVVLLVAAADVAPRWLAGIALVVALALVAESFVRQIGWLRSHRPTAPDPAAGASPPPPPTMRRVTAGATTVLAGVLVWFALVAPNDAGDLAVGAFVRIPLEALVVLGLVLVLPPRPGKILVIAVGVALGVITVVKLLDMGFLAALNRPFDPLSDWSYIGPATQVLADSIGRPGALSAVVAAGLVIAGVLVAVPLAVRRLTRLAARDRAVASRFVGAFAVVWLVGAVVGLQIAPGAPISSADAAQRAYAEVGQIRVGIRDQAEFEAAIADDPAAATPASELLAGLRGKDVIFAFVESYGRVALQDPAVSPGVHTVLDAGTRRLAAAGFSSRSAFLTSPTFGGISWLAHASLQSGLWVDTQRRHDQLMASDRFTLSRAFQRAGWRTVADAPANDEGWPEATTFYRYDQVYDSGNVGYRGPKFGFATIPDQYTLAAFQRAELAPVDRRPVMAEIDLLTSHTPWAPLPSLVDWADLGDGSVYAGMPEQAASVEEVWDDGERIRAAYGRSIEYTLTSVISFVETYGNDDLVLVVVGDHQPAPIVSGPDADHDVPIAIVARDPAVFERIAGWDWRDGLRPPPDAPVWPMDSFRDRLFGAFGPTSR